MSVGTPVESMIAQHGFEVHVPAFEGPLELLLHLIEKNELDITRIALAQVTDEFLAHVETMRAQQQIDAIAEFLTVAAKLLLIKSRALLPKPPQSARLSAGEEDVGDDLIRQLRAYRQYKEAAQWLRERDDAGLRAYVHVASLPRPQKIMLDLSAVTLMELQAAAQAAMYPMDVPRPQEAIQRPRISVPQQIKLIRQRLIRWTKVSYRRLLSREPTRVEAVVTLQAILELMKQRAVRALQQSLFGDIVVEALIPPEQIPEVISTSETPYS